MKTRITNRLAIWLTLSVAAANGLFAATGDNWKMPGTLNAGSSTTVTLVEAQDPETKEPLGAGTYFYKITAKRDSSYTITVVPSDAESPVNAAIYDITMFDYEKTISAPSWESSQDGDNLTQRFILRSSDWDEENDATVTYYLCLDGEVGDKAKVTFSNGVSEYSWPTGSIEDKPISIKSISTTEGKTSGSLFDGYCYLRAKLTKNIMYKFWTTGGTSSTPLNVIVYSEDNEDQEDYPYEPSKNNGGVKVIPAGTGNYIIVVTSEDDEGNGKFTLNYSSMSSRKVTKHPAVNLGKITETGVSADCAPGLRNAANSKYYDKIIDTSLYEMKLEKGNYYVFETSGAAADLILELYKTNSTAAAASNTRGFANSPYDCKLVYKCTATATYYVGVCQNLDEDATEKDLVASPCTFTAKLIKAGVTDAWDPTDDKAAGATVLVPGIGAGKTVKTIKKEGAANGPHTFGALDWVDTYMLPVRKDITYRVATVLKSSSDKSGEAWPLSASLYTLSGTKKSTVKYLYDLNGKISEFTPKANAVYYMDVAPDSVPGVDYGAHNLYVVAVTNKTTSLGVLDVQIGGLTASQGAGWSIVADGKNAVKYPAGPIVLPAGKYKIGFAPVTGWTSPTASVTVVAGTTKTLSKNYTDTFDAANIAKDATDGDGAYKGKKVPTLKPSNTKTQSATRSLWKDDAADWFKFKSDANTYYTFSVSGALATNVTITVYRVNDSAGNIVATTAGFDKKSLTFLCGEDAKNYYVAVTHRDPENPLDASYTLKYSCQNIGVVGFEKSSYTVKDDAASVALKVTRTDGTDGAVRVRWTTQSGTGSNGAQAGDAYLAASGFLSWADGEKAAKTITVKLLPELVSHWSATRKFTVELAPVDELDAAGQLPPAIGTSLATVKITEATKQAPGTLQFATTAASVKAGQPLEVTVKRTGGSDGRVGCVVKQVKGTAVAKTDYKAWSKSVKSLVWEDGDDSPKAVTLETIDPNAGYQPDKTMTLTLTIDTAQSSTAKLGKNVQETVTIVDPRTTQTFAGYQAACKTKTGIAVKSTGTWYFDEDGVLRNDSPAAGGTATFTLTLTGPGKFAFTPQFDNGGSTKNKFTCTIDKATQKVANGTRVVRYFGAGSHTVLFTVTRNAKSGDTGATVAFEPEAVEPFLWKPLAAPTLESPLASAVMDAALTATNAEGLVFRWTNTGAEDVFYRFSLASAKKNLDTLDATKTFAYKVALTNETSLTYKAAAEEAEGGFRELPAGGTYYWRVDAVMPYEEGTGELVATNAVWSFMTLAEGAPTLKFMEGAVDAYGDPAVAPEEPGQPWQMALVQGVSASVNLAVDEAGTNGTEDAKFTYALVSGELPTGLKVSSAGKISGVPSKAGDFVAVIQLTKSVTTGTGKKAVTTATPGATLALKFTVEPLNLASGSFNGLVTTEDPRVTADLPDGLAAHSFGAINVTVAETGAISAKVSLGGKSYTFSGKGWTQLGKPLVEEEEEEEEEEQEQEEEEEEQPEISEDPIQPDGLQYVTATLTATNYLVRSKTKSLCVTNTLTITACREAADVDGALDVPLRAKLNLGLLSADKKSYVTDIEWAGSAVRDNTAIAEELKKIKAWTGYYTVALAPNGLVYRGVQGNGYLTVTISTKGVAKVSGLLADGKTKISSSATCAYLSAAASDSEAPELLFPLYSGTATNAFGGWLRFSMTDDETETPIVRSSFDSKAFVEPIRWIGTSSAATIEGEGFDLLLEPAGGLYDTVVNLQRYYYDLGYKWSVPEPEGLSELSEYLCSSTYNTLVAYPGSKDVAESLSLVNDTVSAVTQKLAYRSDNKKLIDWAKTKNQSNLKFSLTRATGLYTGSFELWGGNDEPGSETKQKLLTTCKHRGVLLLSRDPYVSILTEEENLAPGFYNASVTVEKRTVSASYPFVVKPVKFEHSEQTEELPRDPNAD